MDQMDHSSALHSAQVGRSALTDVMTDVSSILPLAQAGLVGRVAASVALLVSIIPTSILSKHSRSSSRGD